MNQLELFDVFMFDLYEIGFRLCYFVCYLHSRERTTVHTTYKIKQPMLHICVSCVFFGNGKLNITIVDDDVPPYSCASSVFSSVDLFTFESKREYNFINRKENTAKSTKNI